MMRRYFLCLAGAMMVMIGCGRNHRHRRGELVKGFGDEPIHINPFDRIARAMQRCEPHEGYSFDPITLSILASILGNVIRYCIESRMLRLQKMVNDRPDGTAAVRLRGKLHAAFQDARRGEVQLFAEPRHARKHIDAAMAAFVRATPEELRTLREDLAHHEQMTIPINGFVDAPHRAAEWEAISE